MIPKCCCLLLLVIVSMTTLCQADTCYERTDILFILDASGSVGADNFQKQLQFAATFVSNFVIGSARFSVIIFASSASILFDFNAYNDVTALKNAILGISYTRGSTGTAAALRLAKVTGFSSSNGARSGVARIAIVCTDGQSNNPSETAVEAKYLKDSKVLVLAIGIGSGANRTELNTIASFPEDVSVVIDYNKLLVIVYDYSQLVCVAVKLFKCNNQADIYFLLDTSNNIGQDAYQKELKYVGEFSSYVDLQENYIGAATFGGAASKRAFKLGQFTNLYQLNQGLSSAVKLGGVTDTDSALRFVTTQKPFDAAAGGRPNATKIAVILTDGNSGTASQAANTAVQLRSSGVNTIAVGVATPNIAELKTLVADDVLDVVGSLSMPRVLVDRVLTVTALRVCDLPTVSVNVSQTCLKGFEINPNQPTTCIDIDECKTSNPCQHTCVNLDGSFTCTCNTGYASNTTDKTKCDPLRPCPDQVDVVYLVDASGSISSRNFTLQQRFAAKLTHKFIIGPKGAQIAGVLFATDAKGLFKLNTYTSRTDITKSLLGAPYSQGATNTHRGLKYIADNKLFDAATGGRSNAPDVVIVITHEVSYKSEETKQAAAKLKQQGAKVIAVGVGPQVSTPELIAIASSIDDVFVVDFDLLETIEQGVTDRICPSTSP